MAGEILNKKNETPETLVNNDLKPMTSSLKPGVLFLKNEPPSAKKTTFRFET